MVNGDDLKGCRKSKLNHFYTGSHFQNHLIWTALNEMIRNYSEIIFPLGKCIKKKQEKEKLFHSTIERSRFHDVKIVSYW